jgi:hypothetical protein
MVSSVVCQNNTPFRFSVSVRVEGIEQAAASAVNLQDKVVEKVNPEVPPHQTVELYRISRHKQANQVSPTQRH